MTGSHVILQIVSEATPNSDGTGYQNLFGHLPMVNSALSPSTTFLSPLIFSPLTTVPIFVARSSIVSVERLEGLCAWPGSTGLTVIVRCLREMVLCDIANWPAVPHISSRPCSIRLCSLRSAAVRPKRYVFPGRNHSLRPRDD